VHLYHNVVQMQPIGIRGSPYEEKLYELAQRRRLPCAGIGAVRHSSGPRG